MLEIKSPHLTWSGPLCLLQSRDWIMRQRLDRSHGCQGQNSCFVEIEINVWKLNSFWKKVCEDLPIKWVNFIFLHKFSKGTALFSGKNYTDGKIFTQPVAATVATNFKSVRITPSLTNEEIKKILEHTSQSFGHKTGYIGFFLLIYCTFSSSDILYDW